MWSNKMEFNLFFWKFCMRHGFVVFFFSLAIGHKSYELITHALLVRETYIIVVLRNFIGQELLWMQIR